MEAIKPHGNTGKRNAAKSKPKTALLSFRCDSKQRDQLEMLAKIKGVKVSKILGDLLATELAKHDLSLNKATKAYRVIVPVSGGKDSQCCLKMAVDEHGADNVLGLFCDTRFEHPLTYEHVENLKAWYGVKIITLQSDTKTVEGMCTKYKRFPSGIARFCTDALKIMPTKLFLKEYSEEFGAVQVWYGMRTDESQERAKRYQYRDPDELYLPNEVIRNYPKYLGEAGVRYRLPIVDWSRGEVVDYLEGKHNPLYDQGFDRVGCFPCLAAGDKWKIKAFEHDEFGRGQLIKVRQIEAEIGKSVFRSKIGERFNDDDSSHGCRVCEI